MLVIHISDSFGKKGFIKIHSSFILYILKQTSLGKILICIKHFLECSNDNN